MAENIKKHKFIILTLIFLLSFFLRTVYLNNVPMGINADEAAYLYDAKSFIETGKDKWGNPPQITISEYGTIDNRSPLYIWLQIPFVKVLGMNEWSSRLPAAILGSLTVLLTYFLTKKFFSEKVSIIASFLLAISPWHVLTSRIGLECSVLPFFFVLGLLTLMSGINKNKPLLIYLSSFIFAFSVYGYSTNKVFIPLFLLVFFMLNRQWVKNNIRIFTKGLVVFLVTISPLVYLNLSQYLAQQGRFNEISIVNYRHLAPLLFVMQYMLFFTYDFFFPSTKELLNLGMIPATFSKIYFFELIFLVLGVFFIYKSRDKKNRDIILAWLLLYPIPAALTAGGVTHVFRANTAIPVFEIIIAYGIIQVIKKVREAAPNIFKKTMIAFSILALMEVTLFLSYFFFKYPLDSAKHFEYGHKDAFRYTESTQISNNGIVITNKSEVPGIIAQNFIFVLVYLDYSPTKFQTLKIEKTETNKDGWLILKSFDKYSFGDVEKEYNKNPNRVFIVREDELTKIPSKKEVYFPNGEIAFRIIYNEQ